VIRGHRRFVAAVAACALVAACGSHVEAKTTVLHWSAAPDDADLPSLAEACTQASDGRYQIKIRTLPADVDARRRELLRRLLAHDDSADIISADTSLTAELGAAKVLAPVPQDRIKAFTDGNFPLATQASSYAGELVTVPWWLDPYLLWARGAVARRIGLNPQTPLTWTQLVSRARRLDVPIQIDAQGGAGLAAWVNSLVSQAGGQLLVGDTRAPKVGLDTPAGRVAAGIVEAYASAGSDAEFGMGPSGEARTLFAGPHGGLLLAPSSAISDPTVAAVALDLSWGPYPVVDPKAPGGAPLVGMGLGVPLFARHRALAYEAIGCLTAVPQEVVLMNASGHSAARQTIYEEIAIKTGYPFNAVAQPAVAHGVIEPRTPWWHLARRAIDQTWWPVTDVDARATPQQSAQRVAALIEGSPG
jgi:multiple sugar transport system substrate-binding protein